MKAVLLTGHGGPDAPDPVAGQGEVVVDIHAASVNAADYKVRLGGGDTALVGSLISLAGTSQASSAHAEPALPISLLGMPCSG